jgi:23S rRNA pseudouridine2605 synthase
MKRKTDNFNKFYNKKRNSAIKEEFRQEKKAAKKERKQGIERHFEEKRKTRETRLENQAPNTAARQGSRDAVPTGKNTSPAGKFRFDDKDAKGAPTYRGSATASVVTTGEQLPLNKYVAHSGVCSRRDAADLIRKGKVTVNGKVVTEPGTKVVATDTIKFDGKKLTISRNFVYILLNKPKDYITTTDDPQGRKTVLDLIRQATPERVYPVGRLDRNTSGVLLLTNDGDLAQKLAHPSHEIKKIYHVSLDKPLTKADFEKIINGEVALEDGVAHVDVLAYADTKDKTQIGIEIHSGRNRIVRRIFEHLGYDVRGLDRVTYAGLTKKDVQRGKWRFLLEKEVRVLKYLNSSIKGSAARAKDWAATPEAPSAAKKFANPGKPKSPHDKSAQAKPKPALATPKSPHAKPARPAAAHPKGAKPARPRPKSGPRSTPRSKKPKI